jgi:hypothetical protein
MTWFRSNLSLSHSHHIAQACTRHPAAHNWIYHVFYRYSSGPIRGQALPYSETVTHARGCQAEFCPPLDSNLVATLLADIDASSKQQLQILREQLAALAAQAIVDDCSLKDKTPSPPDDIYGSGSSHMTSSQYSAETSTTTDSPSSLESPLAFLCQAFPDISVESLRDALRKTGRPKSLDMQLLVEELLSQELLAAFERENLQSPSTVEEEWQEVTKKKSVKGKKKAARAKAIPLIDIRQRQHQSPGASASPTAIQTETDPWSQLVSLASYLSDLLPPHSASEFLSAFHSPQHATPYDALTSFLNSMKTGKREETAVDNDLITLMTLCVGDDQDDEGFDAILARKCVLATEGRLEDALDLFKLMQDLEFAGPIVHLPTPTLSTRQNDLLTTRPLASPTRAKSISSIPTKRTAARQSTQRVSSAQTAPNAWTYVEKRKPTAIQPHSHAPYVPSYQHKRYHRVIATETPEKSVEAANQVRRHRAVEESWQVRRAEVMVVLIPLIYDTSKHHFRRYERLQGTGNRAVMVTEDR